MLGVTLLNIVTNGVPLFKHATPSDPVYGTIFYRPSAEAQNVTKDSTEIKLKTMLHKVCNFQHDDQGLFGLMCDMLNPDPTQRPSIREIISLRKWPGKNDDV